MRIYTRREWGARSPRSVTKTTWSKRTGFMVHYSGASPDQTPRIIQDYHMDTRGWSDIGYNFLINSITGKIYEGRGWLVVGAHCEGHNTPNIGVCVIGRDNKGRQDVSNAARDSLRWLYMDAVRRKGGNLALLGHRDRGSTACPGDELYAYLRAGLPGTGSSTPPSRPTPADWETEARMALDTIRQGDRGTDVAKSMGLLAAAGFVPRNSFGADHVPDGIAGDGWGDAVEAFQRRRGLKVDRICGPKTWGELLE